MHIHHDHVGGHTHDHDHEHCHCHEHDHAHDHDCAGHCHSCGSQCEHTPTEELMALMKYMISHNGAHARELAELAAKLQETGNRAAYEQVLAAVSDFEKGNMRLSVVLASLGG